MKKAYTRPITSKNNQPNPTQTKTITNNNLDWKTAQQKETNNKSKHNHPSQF